MTNETLHTLETRRSCRAYKPEQITKEELEAVLRAGTFAPSAMNRQSAKIVVVQDAATRAQLTRMNAAVMGKDTDPMYGAPTILVVLADAGSKNAVQDGSLVMGNLMLATASLGLGSCWVQIRRREHDATTSAQDYVAGLLGLPPGMMVLAIIGIGHPVETKAGHPRGALPFAQVSRERFGRRD